MAMLRDVPNLRRKVADMLSDLCNVPAEHVLMHSLLDDLVKPHQRQDLHYIIERRFKYRLRRNIFDLRRVQDVVLAIQDAPEALPEPVAVRKAETPVARVPAPDPNTVVAPPVIQGVATASDTEEMLIWALAATLPVLEHTARCKGPRAMRRHALDALRLSRTTLGIAKANSRAVSSEHIMQHIGMLVALLERRNNPAGIVA